MNKNDLILEMTKAVKNKKTAELLMNSFISNVTAALIKKDDVKLSGFGTFKIVKRKERAGINPKTGEKIKIKSKKVPKFTAAKTLKDDIN